MIILPKDKPVIENLNSYYLDVPRLIEHYQGVLGTGGAHFTSVSAEGVIFFDKDEILNGVFKPSTGAEIKGPPVIEDLIRASAQINFNIHFYKIDPESIYYWSSIPSATALYKDLSTEFTDLARLIAKMQQEQLCGYIDVVIDKGREAGAIFFNNGSVTGGAYSWNQGRLNGAKEDLKELIEKSKASDAVFHVWKIAPKPNRHEPGTTRRKAFATELQPLEELLAALEGLVSSQTPRPDFKTLLKKKFLQKIDRFDFLDPFAAEFVYANGKITFTGDAGPDKLTRGVGESIRELVQELNLGEQLAAHLSPDAQKILSGN